MNTKKWLKRIAIGLGAFILVLFICALLFKNQLFNWALSKVKTKLKTNYGLTLSYENAKLNGFRAFEFKNLLLIPEQEDTLLVINKLDGKVRLWPLLFGDIKLAELNITQGKIDLIRTDSNQCNYCGLLKKKSKKERTERDVNLAESAYSLIKNLIEHIPVSMETKQFSLNFIDSQYNYTFRVDQFSLKNRDFKNNLSIISPGKTQQWLAEGNINPSDLTGNVHFYGSNGSQVEIPLVDRKLDLKASFKEMNMKLQEVSMSGGKLTVKGYSDISNLMVNHPRLSDEDVIIPSGKGQFSFLFGSNFAQLDSGTTLQLGEIKIHPYLRYQSRPDKIYEATVKTENMLARNFLKSLPQGLFSLVKTMSVEGNLQYYTHLYLNSKEPYNVKYESEMRKENFKISDYGNCNLTKLNGSFSYTFYDNGRPIRTMTIGPENPNYASLDMVAPFLQNAVLTSEDPSFYGHRGFIMESIRQSIGQNYAAGRFKRGGSTITMQLVKNVFLSRKKTLSRKAEEIFIVWMIENMGISSKSRMFEVYLNLIEWGPNVFGIGEASRFYFAKPPIALTRDESIYLASIIPRPKAFRYFFDSAANLKPSWVGYFNRISGLMFRRGLTSDSDTSRILNVSLTGPARMQVLGKPTDTALLKSIPFLEDEIDE